MRMEASITPNGRKKMIQKIRLWVKQHFCTHNWELVCDKHQDYMYKCVDCGMIETVDRGTYL
jgi:hypothetical protein